VHGQIRQGPAGDAGEAGAAVHPLGRQLLAVVLAEPHQVARERQYPQVEGGVDVELERAV
jgi:hypothetical protein